MVDARKMRAVELRRNGHSIKTISKIINAAQSSVSLWVREVSLLPEQIAALKANTHSKETIEKRRLSRARSESVKRMAIIDPAINEVGALTKRELWLIGIALYWAEGGKTKGIVRFSNGDPRMIQLIIRFFVEVCMVDKSKLRVHIHIHESLDVPAAESYWQKITGLPNEQFYKTYNKPNKSSKSKRRSLPYGVCDIYASQPNLFHKINGWAEGIYRASIK